MSNISSYLEEAWLNMLKGTEFAALEGATLYCGICNDSATPDELEANTQTNEITGYTGDRKAITWGDVAQVGGAGSAGKATLKNSAAIEFVSMPAPGDTPKVKYAIICTAATAGEILYWCPLAVEKSWNEGDTFRIPAEALVIDLA